MKLNIQFALVEKALAGARIRKGTISAGYNLSDRSMFPLVHAIAFDLPCHSEPPYSKERIENKEEQCCDNTRTLSTEFGHDLYKGQRNDKGLQLSPLIHTASIAMLKLIPAAPKSISERRPNFSMVNTAIHDARKYSLYTFSDEATVEL